MNVRLEAAQALLKAQSKRIFVGFDGFTDTIMKVVGLRSSPQEYCPIPTIKQFGERVLAAAGKSANFELVPTEARIGGNAPLLTRALLQAGHKVVLAGTIGTSHQIEPLFAELAAACEQVFPLGPSGQTDALEFNDGKLFFGQMNAVATVDYDRLTAQIPEEQLVQLLDDCDLFVSANWTMIPRMTDLWEKISSNLLPQLSAQRPRWFFVDLADPAKRSRGELILAVETMAKFHPYFRTVLGLNLSEAQQVYAAVCGNPPEGTDHNDVERLAQSIKERSHLTQVVVHAQKFASVAAEQGTFTVDGPYVEIPLTTTGGGDHFNAGYCQGLLLDLPPIQCLAAGVACSGFYIQQARTPSIQDLRELLNQDNW